MFQKGGWIWLRGACFAAALGFGLVVMASGALGLASQPAPQTPTLKDQLGSVKSINGNVIVLTTDSGDNITVNVQSNARIVRVEPGATTLKDAAPLELTDIQNGDRILVRGLPSADNKSFTAIRVVAMKRADVDAKHKAQSDDWQKRGIGGLVHSVDPAANVITISVAAPGGSKQVAIHVTKDTVLRRYAPDSVKFDDAKASTLAAIQPGDQLRARGDRNADGSELTAEEIVTGAFRNIAGTVDSVDVANNSMTVMDLIAKKTVVVHITANTKLVKLPPQMAQGIAFRMRGQAAGAQGQRGSAEGNRGGADGAGGQGAGRGRGGAQADFQQVVNRLPAATLADLQKGDAVMIVSTQSANAAEVTALELVGGVEPILAAAPSAGEMTLSPWNLSGGAEADIQQ
jgi:Domain of unknown function (DUF5666)